MGAFYLPVLSHFQNENIWIASDKNMRFKITPTADALNAEIWEGPWAYEFSRVEETASFPLSDEGIEALGAWLTERSALFNARAPKSFTQSLAARREPSDP